MKAVILTAGYGRRMQPLSGTMHKALLPVAGTTILERTMDALSGKVNELTIVTGYRAEEIRNFVADRYPSLPVRFVHNGRYDETNNIVSLSLAFEDMEFDDDVLLVECDLLFDAEVLEPLLSASGGNLALVDRWRLGMDGTVVSVAGDVITQVWPSHLQGANFTYDDKYKTLNIYRFDRTFCQDIFRPLLSCYANLIDGNAFYELVLGMLVNMQRHPVQAEIVDGGRWAEVDDPNDLLSARFTFEPAQRPEVLARAFGGLWNFDVLDFSLMRNAHFPNESMMAAMRHALPQLISSYGSSQVVLNEKLAWFLLCPPGRVQVLAGACQVIPLVPELLGGGRALVPAPTFGEWGRAFPDASTYVDGPGIDTAALEKAASVHDVVVVVNPNNPTGTTLSTAWIHDFAARHPDQRVVVDESFVDFSGEKPVQKRLEAEPLDNVLVIKSLSKSLGVPGLRLGYCYSSDEELIRRLGGRLPIWNLSAPAEFLLELLLKHRGDLEDSIHRTMVERSLLRDELRMLPIVADVHESGGNFLLVRLRETKAAELVRWLLAEHGIYVKDVAGRLDEGEWLRLGVRSAPDNARLVSALAQVASG